MNTDQNSPDRALGCLSSAYGQNAGLSLWAIIARSKTIDHCRSSPSGPTIRNPVGWLLATLLVATTITACKVTITVPQGGTVETLSGSIACSEEETCKVDVVDLFFDETFTAVPESDFIFLHWRRKHHGFCGGSDEPCRLFTSAFEGNAALEQFLESDEEFYLEPVFIKPDSWERKENMPTRRMGLGACAVKDRVYAFGGFHWSSSLDSEGPGLLVTEEYDPSTDSWRSRALMNSGRRWPAAAEANDRCYAIGGHKDLEAAGERSVEEFDPETNSWKPRAAMPAGRLGHAIATMDGTIYVFGGTPSPGETAARTVYAYDVSSNKWSRRADMPKGRIFASASTVNGHIYVMGGTETFRSKGAADVQRYNVADDSWSTLPNMPERRAEHGASVVSGRIFIIGGRTNTPCVRGQACDAPPLSSVDEFDPETGKWTMRTKLPGSRTALGAVTVNGKIYAVGGTKDGSYGRGGNPANEAYTPPIGT